MWLLQILQRPLNIVLCKAKLFDRDKQGIFKISIKKQNLKRIRYAHFLSILQMMVKSIILNFKNHMIKGYAVNQKRLEYFSKTNKLIDTLKKYKNCICTIYIWKRYSIIIWIYKKLTVYKQKIIKTIDKIWKKGI